MDESNLTGRIEASVYSLCGIYAASPIAEPNSQGGLSWFSTPIPSPVFNAVYNIGINPNDADDTIEKIKSYYMSRNLPVMWWVGPSTRPEDIGRRLEAHGFRQTSDMPGMAVELHSLKKDINTPVGLVIEQADSREKLAVWARAAGRGFCIPEKVVDSLLGIELSIGFDIPWKRYTAILDGEPVGASGLLLTGDTAGIYNVAVAPEYRGRGIGSAVTLKSLQDARVKYGCSIGVLQSSPMGVSVYGGLGFKEYCRMRQYCLRPEENS